MRYFIGEERLVESENYKTTNIEHLLEWLKDKTEISLDTETEGFFNHSNKVIMLQLSDNKDSFVIDTRVVNCFELIKPYLKNSLILGQNLKFDYKFLKFHGIRLNNIYDTFLAECILTNGQEWQIGINPNGTPKMGRELGLGALTKKYCNKELDKTVRNQFVGLSGKPFNDKQIVYGAEDVESLFKIRELQLDQINKLELNNILNLEFKACLALADIEYNGFKFNPLKWTELAKKAESKIPIYEAELDVMVKNEPKLSKFVSKYIQGNLFDVVERDVLIEYSSPTQMAKVFKALGLQLESTSEKEISKYQNDYPFIKKFIDYKKDCKLTTTYGLDFLKWINKKTGRIHTEFWQILETFRVSSNNPNLQNLPAKNEYLNCFISEDGWSIIGIDYAAQEARLAACGSNDELWLNTFLQGKDLHTEVCKLMFKIDDSLVKTKPDFLRGKTYRDAAKTINFGVLFGMSKFKLSKSLSISIEEAEDLIKQYFQATKQLKSYLDSCAAYGLKNGYIRSFRPYSGIRYFPNWKPDLNSYKDFKVIGEITRASYNTPIQATGAIVTKSALIAIRDYIFNNKLEDKVRLIHVVHDAIYCEVINEFAEEFSLIQAKLMEEAGYNFDLKLKMLTDISIAPCWNK
jgi:DNA polymerase-1